MTATDFLVRPQLRIGAVNYLNTKPLVYDLEKALPYGKLIYDLPSRLADALDRKELEIALVPSVELALHPEWSIISDACIGCLGPVLSVKLLFRTAPAKVRTLALDEGSRTSAVLARILLQDQCKISPNITSLPLGTAPEAIEADAILVIGDRAIRDNDGRFEEVWDLGDHWYQQTALPMVFAMWVARPGVAGDEISTILSKARDNGCRNIDAIARQQSEEMKLPFLLVQEYLGHNLRYCLGTEQLRGLELFYQRAAEYDLIAQLPNIEINDCSINYT